jgi:hypothetical protein
MIVLFWRVRTSLEKASSFGLSVVSISLPEQRCPTYLVLS